MSGRAVARWGRVFPAGPQSGFDLSPREDRRAITTIVSVIGTFLIQCQCLHKCQTDSTANLPGFGNSWILQGGMKASHSEGSRFSFTLEHFSCFVFFFSFPTQSLSYYLGRSFSSRCHGIPNCELWGSRALKRTATLQLGVLAVPPFFFFLFIIHFYC